MAPPPPHPRAPPELNADAIAEILIRIPPDEPAHLIRACLVCKSWLRLLSDPAFLHRYREFHQDTAAARLLPQPLSDRRILFQFLSIKVETLLSVLRSYNFMEGADRHRLDERIFLFWLLVEQML
ncbi:hypothetical protein EJB05_54220, partial [Eragrostis curvula]